MPAQPSGEKLADKTLPALTTVKPNNKKTVIKAACKANDIYEFATDQKRLENFQSQGRTPAALINQIVDVSDPLRELNQHPKLEGGITVTASVICLAHDIAAG